jgi:SagB-type dehydrogenase family enzyme
LARIARHPELLLWWSKDGLHARNLQTGRDLVGGPEVAAFLGLFDRPREPNTAARRLPRYDAAFVRGGIRLLRKLGFLLTEREAEKKSSRLEVWKQNAASAFYHSASRDLRYLDDPAAIEGFVRARILPQRRPPLSRRWPVAVRRKLPASPLPADLEATLATRRTVRDFARAPVPFPDFSSIVRGTWGCTGMHDGGLFGRLMKKTSPSGGSLHPIECYVLAWNVRDLSPGLYHYDVGGNELRRLKRGDFRAAAVRAASGQSWVGRAAFLCVMTAAFGRSLWKYQAENSFRILWLDAGHLAQTFCLLATSRGLGPFTTAAIQDSYIEMLLGIDGLREFPVYLCGAGIPAVRRGRREAPRSPEPRRSLR